MSMRRHVSAVLTEVSPRRTRARNETEPETAGVALRRRREALRTFEIVDIA